MSLRIDTERAFRTPAELDDLVDAIVESDGKTGQESHWVEWKGPLLIDKAEGQFQIARTILGFANRDPERAARDCEGVAYLVVGAEPQSVPGVDAIDFADLGQGIDRYVQGVRWAPHYVAHDDGTVLVIVVEAPRPGDPIHTLRKGTDRFHAGTIFHRGAARTAPANPQDVTMLSTRLVAAFRAPGLALKLSAHAPNRLMRLDAGEIAVNDWLAKREAHVRATVEKPDPPKPSAADPDSSSTKLSSAFITEALGRPAEQSMFDSAVEKYLEKCRKRLRSNIIARIIEAELNVVTLRVVNESEDPIAAVVVKARFPRGGVLVRTSSPDVNAMPDPPEWPTQRDALAAMVGVQSVMPLSAMASTFPSPITQYGYAFSGARVDEDNEDYFEVIWPVGDLLAESDDELDIYMPLAMSAPEDLVVEMTGRSKSHRGVARGTSTLTADLADVWHIADWYDPSGDD